MHLGIIGYGSIAKGLVERLHCGRVTAITALVRPTTACPPDAPVRFVTEADALIAAQPGLIVECAGHAAVAAYVPMLLRAGHDIVIASLGALADRAQETELRAAEASGDARLILPSGAIGGLDLLRALALAGPVEVHYQGVKPPAAWAGSAAAEGRDLSTLAAPLTLFDGTGREAALAFPKNANVVAALALAGAGFDDLRVKLIADPAAKGNCHSYRAQAAQGRFEITIEATPTKGNARTSLTTVLSLLTEIENYRLR